MEIQLVHTTGSPSRHDSDSESPYDKNRQLKSSSEMALHRKQSRRCKKQMSERERRKRMNTSMEKLGLLVYGKTFKDGLKVDKATLLKDAYEKLQTMKDDYHKGYETAISSTQTFLDGLDGCPQDVKDALTRHLHLTLQRRLHRCHSTTADLGPPEDSDSDSGSPQPMMSSVEALSGQDVHPQDVCRASSELNPQRPRQLFCTSTPSSVPEEASTSLVHTEHGLSTASSRPQLADQNSGVARVMSSCRTVAEDRAPKDGVRTPLFRAVAEISTVHLLTTHADRCRHGEAKDSSSRARTSSPSVDVHHRPSLPSLASLCSQGLWDVTPPSTGVDPHTPGQERPVRDVPSYPPPSYPFAYLYPSPSSQTATSLPKISPYVTPFAPQDPLYLGSTPPTLLCKFPASSGGTDIPTPTTSSSSATGPFLGSHQPHPAHHPLPAHAPSHHLLRAHTPAHFRAGHTPARYYGSGGSSRVADDSGYMSPVVPSPLTASNTLTTTTATPRSVIPCCSSVVQKRYLRDMAMAARGLGGGGGGGSGAEEDEGLETDEENDREVERVMFRTPGSRRYDSDTSSE